MNLQVRILSLGGEILLHLSVSVFLHVLETKY